MVASVLQVLVGFSGLIGFLMRFIGPLTIAPTISLIGLSLYDSAGVKAGSHWGISAMYVTILKPQDDLEGLKLQIECKFWLVVPYNKAKTSSFSMRQESCLW